MHLFQGLRVGLIEACGFLLLRFLGHGLYHHCKALGISLRFLQWRRRFLILCNFDSLRFFCHRGKRRLWRPDNNFDRFSSFCQTCFCLLPRCARLLHDLSTTASRNSTSAVSLLHYSTAHWLAHHTYRLLRSKRLLFWQCLSSSLHDF